MPEDVYVKGTLGLDQFLKWSRVITTGGQGKMLIADGLVKVNGSIEKRRTRKLADGDLVEVEGMGSFYVVFK